MLASVLLPTTRQKSGWEGALTWPVLIAAPGRARSEADASQQQVEAFGAACRIGESRLQLDLAINAKMSRSLIVDTFHLDLELGFGNLHGLQVSRCHFDAYHIQTALPVAVGAAAPSLAED